MNWDEYYLKICNAVASNSKCLSRKIGAIIVLDKSIISTGYNGPPRNIPQCDTRSKIEGMCPRHTQGFKSGEGLHLCIAGHAERNALINAARHGIAVKGASMYMNCPIPCKDCLIEIINAGIEELIVTDFTLYDEMSQYLLDHSYMKLRMFYKED